MITNLYLQNSSEKLKNAWQNSFPNSTPTLVNRLLQNRFILQKYEVVDLVHSPETAWSPQVQFSLQLFLIYMLKTLNS